MVSHEPGSWFEESLAAVGALDYPSVEVVIVDAASILPVEERVRSVLPDARVIRLEQNRGFGRSINAVLPAIKDSPFLVLAHDDAIPAPGAVRAMVEEAFRSNAAVVGPKLLQADDSSRLLSAGEGVDRFGFPVPLVERHELDQEQHDGVRDVFNVPDAFTLVRTDLLTALGGFDEAASFFGDDLDLCWRAHVAGARVLVAPAATVRHVEALAERRARDDRRRMQFRHRLRVMLTSYRLPTLVLAVPQLLVVHLVEAVFALLTGRPGQARDVVIAWTWNLRRIGSLRRRRSELRAVRLVRDSEVRSLQVRGSARVAAFLRGQLATDQDTFGSATTLGRRLTAGFVGPGIRTVILTWAVVIVVLVVGSRHLLTRPIPAVGEFVPFPDDLWPMFTEWASSWRRAGLGSEGVNAPANLLVGVAGAAFLGATGLLRTVLILGMLPLALLGVWRLMAPVRSARASAVALLAYASIPLGYDSLATGSWRGLVAYAIAPWVLVRLLRAAGTAPFGAVDELAGPVGDVPPLWRQALALGAIGALAAVLDPLFVLLPLLVWVALVPGSVLVGGLAGLGRMLVVSVGAALVAVAVHAPWAVELVGTSPSWDTFVGADRIDGAVPSLTHLLRFDTGPIGSSVLNVAILVAAAFVLLVGRGWRLLWAVRAWSVAASIWALAWVASLGWLPFALPGLEMLLAPAAAALALSVGLGAAAFEIDVRRSTFGWRQFATIAALGALVVTYLPVAAGSVGGRWDVPRGSHHQALAFLDAEAAESDFRVLWFGDAEVLPLGSWPLGDHGAYATTIEGTPALADLWPGAGEGRREPLRGALDLALTQGTNRLGRLLAPMGVRYLVVVDQGAPEPFGGVVAPSPPAVGDALAEQLDLEQVDINPALTVYRNAAWVPTVSVHPQGAIDDADVDAIPDGARLVASADLAADATGLAVTSLRSRAGAVEGPAQVLVGARPSGWEVLVDGSRVPGRTAFGWAGVHDVDAGGTVEVRWATPLQHRLILLGQGLLVLVLAAVMYVTRLERRLDARHRRHIADPASRGTP